MTAEGEERRRRTVRAGYRAEQVALLWLVLKGYRILARRYVVPGGEIDIVARHRDTIVFVEVKARPTLEAAHAAITPAKRRRLDRAASAWLRRHPWAATLTLRGDTVMIAPWTLPRHIVDAMPLRI